MTLKMTGVLSNKYILAALSVTGGIISGLAWSSWCSGLILLFSLVPFLIIENQVYNDQRKFSSVSLFVLMLPGFFIFNILTLGWVRVASLTAAICIIAGLSFLMSFVIWLAHIVRLKTGNLTGRIALIAFWLTFEYISLNTIYLSPWINLGNGLSKDIIFIQWYEITGVGGGTLWILISNLLLTLMLVDSFDNKGRKKMILFIWVLVIIIPSAFSVIRYYSIQPSANSSSEVLIIQPNSDPYSEKFTVPFEIQLGNVIEMAEKNVSNNTDWVVTPETTVDDPVDEAQLYSNKYIRMIKNFVRRHPEVCVISGLVSSRKYYVTDKVRTGIPDTARVSVEYFNSAFKIDTGSAVGIYHKSKLVTGIEMELFKGLQNLLNRILPDFGGTKWGYGIQKERTCFEHPRIKMKIAPIICYESVFGNYVTKYVRNGAEALFIITNDGWWKNTAGYRQHLSYASLRAIETRRPVVRAANTGVSCIIDLRGKRIQESGWWTKTIIKGKIIPEKSITTYVRMGDLIMRISALTGILILILTFVVKPLRKK